MTPDQYAESVLARWRWQTGAPSPRSGKRVVVEEGALADLLLVNGDPLRTAGGETAFRGTRRLRLDRALYRQRVGREHRLTFRVHAQELEAVDLVPRKDLERTIRELSRG